MTLVPLGTKAYKRSNGFVPEVVLRNLLLEKDESGLSPDGTMRIQRPGLTRRDTYNGIIRGMAYRDSTSQELVVAGSELRVNGTVVGYLAGSGLTPMATTNFFTAILSDGSVSLWNGSALIPVSMPDGRQVADIEQINSYIILLCPDGRFYWMLPGETTVDPLNFATAESSPDNGIAIRRLGDEFWIFGPDSIEPWQPTGEAELPFQLAAGRVYPRGCLSRDTVRRFDNSLFWVGEDCNVYRGGAVPQLVSDDGIAERIRKRTELPTAWVFGFDGHKIYVLRIPGQGTFGFDAQTSLWSEFASEGSATWLAHVGYELNGNVVAGSWLNGAIWTLDPDSPLDDGAAFVRTVTGTIAVSGQPPRNDSITIGVGAASDCTVKIRWKDGQDDYPAYPEEVDIRAPFDLATVWRLGSPDQPYRTFEVSITDPVSVRVAGMIANEAWQ